MEKLWYPGEVRTSRGLVEANGRDIKFCTAKPVGFSDGLSPDDIRTVVFEHGVGEIGWLQRRIIVELARFGLRVVAFNSDLLAAGSGINKETVNAHREAYLRVANETGILETPHDLVAHSLGGFTAAAGPLANIGQNEDNGHQHTQVDKAILLAPASVTPESYLSEAWKDWAWTLDLATRLASFRAHERSWKEHRNNLAKSFFKTLLTEAKKGRKDPQVALAGLSIVYEMRKLNRVPDAFATLANVSVVPEIINAIKHGVGVSIVSGNQDQLFPIGQLTEAISSGKKRTNLGARVPVVEVWGNGHSSLGTDAGHNILNVLAFILRNQPNDGTYKLPHDTWRKVPTEL